MTAHKEGRMLLIEYSGGECGGSDVPGRSDTSDWTALNAYSNFSLFSGQKVETARALICLWCTTPQ